MILLNKYFKKAKKKSILVTKLTELRALHPHGRRKIDISRIFIQRGQFMFVNDITQVQILQRICKSPDSLH